MNEKYIDISDLLKLHENGYCNVNREYESTSKNRGLSVEVGDSVLVTPKKETDNGANVTIKVTSACSEKITGQIIKVRCEEDGHFYCGANVEVAIEKIYFIRRQ